jgi:hypothetical protein
MIEITEEQSQDLRRQMHFLSRGIDAVDVIANCVPRAIEQEIIIAEDAEGLIGCVSYSLLHSQRKILKIIYPDGFSG